VTSPPPASPPETGTTRVGPFSVAWTETGPPGAPRVLLLHGLYAGAHSFEWRALTPVLAATHRVRVPDLLGAGASDRPDLEYTRAVVQDVVDELILDAGPDTIVVASSLTAAYALRAVAGGVPAATVVLITPSGMGRPREREQQTGGLGGAMYQLARHTPIGDALTWALTSGPSVRWFQTHKTYANPEVFTTDELVETRRAGRLVNAKHLQLAFVFGRLFIDVAPEAVTRVAPLVIWGCGQDFVDDDERFRWRDAGAEVVTRPSGLPHVEEPEQVAALITGRPDGPTAAPPQSGA
jgi:pimeloyl-ACP methyl ester carboxylesterase